MEQPENQLGSSRIGGVSLRADAERNRRRIVSAARLLFATEGLGVSMGAIAREAGVGKATLFRHFGSQQELLEAVFADRMRTYVDLVDAALEAVDPWRAFVDFVWAVCEMQARDRGFADLLTLSLRGTSGLEADRDRAYRGFLGIIQRAKESGHLREDFESEDLVVLLMANGGVVASTSVDAPEAWRRLVGQMLRGFASSGAPMEEMPASPTSEDLFRAMGRDSAQPPKH